MLASVKRALLIVNPYSTHVTGRRITEVEAALRERDRRRDGVHAPPGHATELAAAARRRRRRDLRLLRRRHVQRGAERASTATLPLGFLPGGGTSVLPRALGLPRDPVAAARQLGAALAEGRVRRISLGRVNGRRFSFSAGLGFDAEAVRRLDELGRDAGGSAPGRPRVHARWS